MLKLGYITHDNGEYVVHAESGRVFGRYKTEAEAKKRLAQMEYFKHMKKTAAKAPGLKNFFAPEPLCKVHGSATKCTFGKAPNFAKMAAEVVDLSVRTGPFANHPKCKVYGAGYKCELSPLYIKPKGMPKKAEHVFKKLTNG